MHILALLSDRSFTRIRGILPRAWPLEAVLLADLERRERALIGATIVVEPDVLPADLYASVLDVAARTGASVVLYTALSSAVVGARIVQAMVMVPAELTVFECEQEATTLRLAVSRTNNPSTPALLFRILSGRINLLPWDLAARVIALFGGASIPTSTQALFAGLPVTAHSARGWLRDARFRGAARLLAGARVARAFEHAQSRQRGTLDDLAESCGFGGVSGLDAACRLVAGLAPSSLLRTLDPADVAARIAVRLTR